MKYTFVPLLVGLIMGVLRILRIFSYLPISPSDTLILTLLDVIVSVLIVWYYSDKYNIKKTLWVILAVIFGGWALIAFNFTILGKDDEEFKLSIKRITKEEYDKLQIADVFGTISTTNRYFAKILGKNLIAKLSWTNNLIYPKIVEITKNFYYIGMDKTFVIFTQNRIVFRLNLNYDFNDAKIWTSKVIIATDLEVIVLNMSNCNVENVIKLTDLYRNMSVMDGSVNIRCNNSIDIKQSLV